MTIIPLSKEFLPAVLDGRKVSTIRRGRRSYPLGEGLLRAGNEDVPVKIQSVRYSNFQTLTETDARQDGFGTLSELRSTLLRFYPQLQNEDEMTIIEFECQRS